MIETRFEWLRRIIQALLIGIILGLAIQVLLSALLGAANTASGGAGASGRLKSGPVLLLRS